jgi:hypothetical protein
MIKITHSLIALGCAGALALAVASPTLAKTKASSARAKSPSSRYHVRAPVPVAPVARCRFGVWDPYGLRCDDPASDR